MLSLKTTARVVGVLFIVATAAAIVGGTMLLPIEDPLNEVVGAEGRIVMGAVVEAILAVSAIAIAVLLFPLLKSHNEGLALGYVGARTVEGVFVLAGSVSGLLVLTVARDLGQTAAGQSLADLMLAAREWTYWLGPTVFFSISALILYTLLYRARLVPVWLSMWGLVGGALLLVSGLLEMFGQDLGAWQAAFSAPIGLNEMVLAVWLILKGFDEPQTVPEPERDLTLV